MPSAMPLLMPQAKALLTAEPKPNTAEADIALAFQQSALKSTAETDPLFGALALRWMPADRAAQSEAEGGPPVWHPARCTSVSVPRGDAWDGLFLECAVEWPLQLLFPPEVRQAMVRLGLAALLGKAAKPGSWGSSACHTADCPCLAGSEQVWRALAAHVPPAAGSTGPGGGLGIAAGVLLRVKPA